ncbi:hypothetical protein [Alteromonas facilis]|uniref:hypothetical protein n=1 Tax=Alteromonas facilis TaxID=2048004 RepID=UPI000C282E29|nr:hypothetical protein [Alteromonas facilis]
MVFAPLVISLTALLNATLLVASPQAMPKDNTCANTVTQTLLAHRAITHVTPARPRSILVAVCRNDAPQVFALLHGQTFSPQVSPSSAPMTGLSNIKLPNANPAISINAMVVTESLEAREYRLQLRVRTDATTFNDLTQSFTLNNDSVQVFHQGGYTLGVVALAMQ